MPAPHLAGLKHLAVLLGKVGADGFGQPIVLSTPTEVPCRWEDSTAVIVTEGGDQIQLSAVVYAARSIDIGSILWKGAVASFPAGTSFANEAEQLHEVVGRKVVPDIKARQSAYIYQLRKWKHALGTQS